MAAAFDESELLDRVGNDITFLGETVQMLADDGVALMEEVRRAVAVGDSLALARSAHALKGMISNFCAPDAQQSAFELERMGRGGDLAAAPAAVEQLQGRLRALTAELIEFVRVRS